MGYVLSIDFTTNVVFDIMVALVGATIIVQTSQVARLYRRSSAPDLEHGLTEIIETNVPTTEPDVEDPMYSSCHSVEHEENMRVPRNTLPVPSMEGRGASLDSMSMTEQLQCIGTLFETAEAHDEYDLLEDIADMAVDIRTFGHPLGQTSIAD